MYKRQISSCSFVSGVFTLRVRLINRPSQLDMTRPPPSGIDVRLFERTYSAASTARPSERTPLPLRMRVNRIVGGQESGLRHLGRAARVAPQTGPAPTLAEGRGTDRECALVRRSGRRGPGFPAANHPLRVAFQCVLSGRVARSAGGGRRPSPPRDRNHALRRRDRLRSFSQRLGALHPSPKPSVARERPQPLATTCLLYTSRCV